MKKKVYIRGMHCVACEKLLEDEISKVPFVKEVKVDRKKEIAEIRYGIREPNTLAIKEIVSHLGYEASEEPWKGSTLNKKRKINWKDWMLSSLIVLLVLTIIRIFQNSGFIPNINADSPSLSYGISFVIGLVASVSSCLAVVGGVVVAFSEKYKTDSSGMFESAIKPNLFFHFGRIAVFFLLGGILGFIGGEINISGSFVSLYTIFIAAVMLVLALNILGILPSISNWGVAMPKALTKHWSKLKESNHKAAPFILGGLSFFLPCGFTQSMQIFALASGSFWKGAWALSFFALGTLPVLLILGIASSWTKSKKIAIFQKAAGLLILIFSLYTFSSGLAIRGVKSNIFAQNNQTPRTVSSDAPPIQEQIIKMSITSSGFSPSLIRIKKDVPVRWIIEGEQITGCTNKIIVPSLNIAQGISSGETTVKFTPDKAGEIPFSCWMGMVRGKFIVE